MTNITDKEIMPIVEKTFNLKKQPMTTKLTQNQMIAEILIKEILTKSYIESELCLICNEVINLLKDMKQTMPKLSSKSPVEYLQDLIRAVDNFKVETCYTPEYHVKNALLAALTGKDHMVVISWLADAYKYALQKEYDRMQNENINQ